MTVFKRVISFARRLRFFQALNARGAYSSDYLAAHRKMKPINHPLLDPAELDQAVFENSPDCVKLLDLGGRLLAMNGNGQCIMGIDNFTSLCGTPWTSLWPEESRADIRAALNAALKGSTGHFSGFCSTMKGTPKWWNVIVSPIQDNDKNVIMLLCISRDVTDLYRAKEELQAAITRLQFSMHSAQLGEWELNLETGNVLRSPRHDQCFGYESPLQHWDFEQFINHIHSDDRQQVSDVCKQAVETCQAYQFESRVVWSDRSVHWISVHGSVIVEGDKASRLRGIVKDITTERRADLLMSGQKKAFELVVRGSSLSEILSVLASTAELQSGGTLLASILLLDKDRKHLRHGAAPSLPSAYSQAVDGIAVGPRAGSCGTAAFRQQVVIVRDILTDPLWADYRELARAHNLRACWSTPIASAGGKLYGTFAFYSAEVHGPTHEEREAMNLLVNTAALVLDRHQETEQREETANTLQETQARLESTLAAAEVATWAWDLRTSRLCGDRNLAWLYCQNDADHIDIPVEAALKAVHTEDLPRVQQTIHKAIENGDPYEIRYRLRHISGQYHSLVTRGRVQYDAAGTPIKLLGVTLDITRQRLAEEALHRSEERYRTLFELMDQGFCLIEVLFSEEGEPRDYRFLEANRAFSEQTGIIDGVGKTALELFPNLEAHWIENYGRVAITGKSLRFENKYEAMDRWFDVYATSVDVAPGCHVAILFTDITERKRTEQKILEFNAKLERQANYDALTGLPNRRLFRDRLDREIRHAHAEQRKIALLFLDLDRFKEVNDLLGHDAGDALLEQVAQRLEQCLRTTDTIARLGGDEFTIILTDPDDVKHAEVTAQRILDALLRPFDLWHEKVRISCSLGITIYPDDALLPENLIRNADQAMYRSKAAGRNKLSFFQNSMQRDAMNRLKRIGELHYAIPNKEFELYFQPIIELATGRIIKAEALIRWHHPVEGLLGPGHFINIAEEIGLIHDIGDWVFREAAAHSKRWSDLLGHPFQISINKSPLQFLKERTSLDWITHLNDMGLAKQSMVIEITEGLLLNLTEPVLHKLRRLREAGFEFSMDDFGTGYSSMSYLKKLDIDYLKIDKSFVHDMLHDETARTIVETVIVMAHKLGLKVVAEGVETGQQCGWLRTQGCNYGQGYWFSKPVPAVEFERLLKNA